MWPLYDRLTGEGTVFDAGLTLTGSLLTRP